MKKKNEARNWGNAASSSWSPDWLHWLLYPSSWKAYLTNIFRFLKRMAWMSFIPSQFCSATATISTFLYRKLGMVIPVFEARIWSTNYCVSQCQGSMNTPTSEFAAAVVANLVDYEPYVVSVKTVFASLSDPFTNVWSINPRCFPVISNKTIWEPIIKMVSMAMTRL